MCPSFCLSLRKRTDYSSSYLCSIHKKNQVGNNSIFNRDAPIHAVAKLLWMTLHCFLIILLSLHTSIFMVCVLDCFVFCQQIVLLSCSDFTKRAYFLYIWRVVFSTVLFSLYLNISMFCYFHSTTLSRQLSYFLLTTLIWYL